jgi:hypothetical protein
MSRPDFHISHWAADRARRPLFLYTQQRQKAMAEVEGTQTWPELAIGLYDKLTGRGAQITYDFEDFDLYVPSKVGEEADRAHWKMDGTLKIRTKDDAA